MPYLNPAERSLSPPPRPIQFEKKQIVLLDAEVDSLIRTLKARKAFGVSGAALAAAVLDTGLRVTHRDFAGRVPARRNFTTDYGADPNDVSDGQGHGTNVAGIIAAGDLHVGIAPGASIVPLKVLTNQGGGTFQWVLDALDWILNDPENHGISVVSMSLGDSSNDADDGVHSMDPIRDRVLRLRALRIPVVVAAGNDYFKFKAEGMGFPAILTETISVGAVYDANEGPFSYQSGAEAYSTAADRLTPFSQRLHESTNTRTRTDIFAPGAPVTSSGIDSDEGESVQQGTSQATPVVTGVILLMQEFFKRTAGVLPPVDLLVECLRNGAVRVHDGDDEDDNVPHTQKEFLRVDAFGALEAVRRKLQHHLLSTQKAFVP
ncbi:MAG: S8 family serine peptidase [Thermoanaerobaculia bacterium]|jgi:subtilisin family serine protease|nr:S8 family serine peptidase [Thermoanaerobaculia bacterium]